MKKFVFVLMPFGSKFNDIYKLGIKAACNDENMYCERVDEQYYEGSMLDRIYNQITHADYLIADMSGKNPNVFYEVGYAHALGKKVILITQNGEDIPFDMKHYKHIIYPSISYLKEQLHKNLSYYLCEDSVSTDDDFAMDITFNGQDLRLDDDNPVVIKIKKEARFEQYKFNSVISFAFHNTGDMPLSCQKIKVFFSVSQFLPLDLYGSIILADNMQGKSFSLDNTIYPKTWFGKNFEIAFDSSNYDYQKILSDTHDGQITINTPLKVLRYPFTIKLELVQ